MPDHDVCEMPAALPIHGIRDRCVVCGREYVLQNPRIGFHFIAREEVVVSGGWVPVE